VGTVLGRPELGYVYLSIESATNDVYGGHRPGNNLFSDSLVCLNIKTGKMVWYQQLVHHDIWDYDMPPHPILLNLTVDGKPVRAVVQLTKQAFAYAFDRTNGRPVFGWTEKPCRRPTCRRNGRRRRSRSRTSRRGSMYRASPLTI
jgi:quinoprotein glucose dehydrogenase